MYDSIKAWTCKLGRIEKLYAFSYEPPRPEKEVNGWVVYDARKEWRRLGISEKGTDKGWRISNINADYDVRSARCNAINCCTQLPYSFHQHIRPFFQYLPQSQTILSSLLVDIDRKSACQSLRTFILSTIVQ